MYVISLLNNKGGVFKTTIAFNLAKQYLRNNRTVTTVDFDQQKNLSRLLPNITRSGLKVSDIDGLNTDYVIIDTGPTFEMDHIQLMQRSDLVIVPLHLEGMDLEQTTNFLETAKSIGVMGKLRLIVNHSGHHTQMYKVCKPFVEEICKNYGVSILCELRRNQAVSKANLEAKTVFEIPSPPDVRKEFKEFFKAVGEYLGNYKKQKMQGHVPMRNLEQGQQPHA